MKYLQPSFQVGGATKDYDEGFDRTFGERQSNKGKRWVYRKNPETGEVESFEVGTEPPLPEGRIEISTDRHYENMCATDGTDIGSRRKHREYMRINGLTLADDFKGEWAKARKEREAYRKGERVDPGHREAIGRAAYELEKRRKR